MSDPNLKDFYVRLGRIEKIRRSGGAFEATGTLGFSSYAGAERKKMPLFRPLLVVFLAVIGVKAVILHQVGADTYTVRVEALRQGSAMDQVGAFIMQADPLTQIVAAQITDLIG